MFFQDYFLGLRIRLRKTQNIVKLFLLILIFIPLVSCDNQQEVTYTPEFTSSKIAINIEYIFGIHPLHNPQHLFEVFDPMISYLSSNIEGVSFKLEASRNYAAYDAKLYAKKFHFSLPNPYQTINAIDKGYHVFAKMGDDKNFRGIFLVRKDSGIKRVRDLKGKTVSYPAPTALAATMMPQYFLQNNGVDVMNDIENHYVGSQESSVMNVFLGKTAAAATWPPPWKALTKARPELAEQLTVIWETDPLLNNGLVVLPEVPQEVVDQVKDLLIHLHEHEAGRAILTRMELSRYEAATDASYQPIRQFVKEFSNIVRPLN